MRRHEGPRLRDLPRPALDIVSKGVGRRIQPARLRPDLGVEQGVGVSPLGRKAQKVREGVEAAVKQGWERFIGEDGVFIGMTGFGASAPYERLYKEFGITAEATAEAALKALG